MNMINSGKVLINIRDLYLGKSLGAVNVGGVQGKL